METPVKEIPFNRADQDFAYLLNGEIVGFAPTYLQAEAALTELVYNLLSRQNTNAAALSPEEAEAILEAQQMLAREEAAEAGRKAAQAELETMEYDAGVEETRAPHPVAYSGGDVEFTFGTEGAFRIYAAQRDEPAYGLRPDEAYALYLFFAKLPHIHLFLSAPPTSAPVTIGKTLKSILPVDVFRTFPTGDPWVLRRHFGAVGCGRTAVTIEQPERCRPTR